MRAPSCVSSTFLRWLATLATVVSRKSAEQRRKAYPAQQRAPVLQSSRRSDRIFAGSEFIRGIPVLNGGKTMKIKQAISSAILVVLLTAPTAWAQDNIRAAMEAANKEWSAAYNSMNGKAFPALYTKDAVLMPPGVQPIDGAEAIGQFWTDLIKAGNRKNFAIEIASIQRDGKYAYQTARWTLDVVKDNGEVTKVAGNSVRIFEEQPDGKWLLKVHIYNLY
jgi:ketosteroid isomerase-like protein